MCATFRDEDVAKRVVNANGEPIGTVTRVEGDTARVEPSPGVVDSIRAAFGWRRSRDDALSIHEDAVAEIGMDVIRLEAESGEPADPAAVRTDDEDSGPHAGDRAEPDLEATPEREAGETSEREAGVTAGPDVAAESTAASGASDGPIDGQESPETSTGDPSSGQEPVDESDAADEIGDESSVLEDEIDAPDATETPDAADAIDTGADLENAGRDDADATGDPDGTTTAASAADPADELDRGPDLEAAVAPERADRRSAGGRRLDAAARPRTAADCLEGDRERATGRGDEPDHETGLDDPALEAVEEKPALETDLEEPTPDARDDAESGALFEAAFAPQRAAIRGSKAMFESGLAVQRGAALGALEGEKELQRRQLEAVRTGTRGTLGVLAAMADAGTSDRRSARGRRTGEAGTDGRPGARLELIDDVDPTYRERLVDAGIVTLDDLAAAEPDDVVDAASVTRECAARWIDRAAR